MGKDIAVIVPAAGFGRRVGSPESKEMLIWEGEVLIDQALKLAQSIGAKIVVATRREKLSLIQYLESHSYFQNAGELVYVSPTQEWPETLLNTHKTWLDKNLLVLPDTRWAPEDIYQQLLQALDEFEISAAVHEVADRSTWGCLDQKDQALYVNEKSLVGPGNAWGLLAFRKKAGQKLFQAQLQSTLSRRSVPIEGLSLQKFPIQEFQDVTR